MVMDPRGSVELEGAVPSRADDNSTPGDGVEAVEKLWPITLISPLIDPIAAFSSTNPRELLVLLADPRLLP